MDQNQGEMIDSIIEKHRQNIGKIFEWNPLFVEFIVQERTEELRTIVFSLNFLKMNAYVTEYDENPVITMLTEKGQQWKGYKDYLKNGDTERKAGKRKAWKEKNWLLIAIVAFLIGFFANLFVEFISKKYFHESKESSSISQPADPVNFYYKYNHENINRKAIKYNTDVKHELNPAI